METQETETKKSKAQAKVEAKWARKARIGHNFLDIRAEGPHYLKITAYEAERANKRGETNPFFDAVNLETGEEGSIFLDGGLRGQFAKLGLEKAVGKSFEISYKGMVETEMEIDGKLVKTEVNSYDVFEIEAN